MYRVPFVFLIAVVTLGCTTPAPDPNVGPANVNVEKAVRDAIAKAHKVNAGTLDMRRPLSSPPLNMDELDIIELVMDLEEQLQITLPDEAVDRFGNRLTAADLVTVVSSAQKGSRAPRQKR